MKKILAIAAAAAFTVTAGKVIASDSASLNVTAEVTSTCIMTGGTLDFGSLDPTNPVIINGSSTGVSVTCTSGTAYTLGENGGTNDSGGQKNLVDGVSGTAIPYAITLPANGTGNGTQQTITITGVIAANTYNTAPAGTYTDTVELTVTP